MDPALAELLRAEEAAEDRVIEAIIRFRRPGAEVPGARIVARFGGEVATCRVALSEVRSVREHWETLSLKAARTLGADLRRGATGDRGRPNDVRRPPGLPLTGAGVVVGVVDWGVGLRPPELQERRRHDTAARPLGPAGERVRARPGPVRVRHGPHPAPDRPGAADLASRTPTSATTRARPIARARACTAPT